MTSGQNRPLAFVTATKLEQFRDKRVIQRVRKAVMRDYMYKNPPRGAAQERLTPSSQDQDTQPSSDPVEARAGPTMMMPPPPRPAPSVSRARRRDSKASCSDVQPEKAARVPGINPMIRTTANQQALFTLADSLNQTGDRSRLSNRAHTNLDAIMAPGGTLVAEMMQFIVAFTRRVDDATTADPFARSAPLPETVDLDRLKVNCATYFGSKGMADLWLPMMLSSPQAFLAGLCISAPYTDLMTAAQDGVEPTSYTDTRQTLEILDIVPRMIHDSISEHGDCDSNIVAVVQLLFGQLSTSYTALVGSHQLALKSMITSRGGLHMLGGNGVLAMTVSLINMEANILRSEAADPMYVDWCTEYLAKNPHVKSPSPEGPLFSLPDDGLQDLATSPLCSPETLELIILMQDLTDKVLELGQLQQPDHLETCMNNTVDGVDRETMVRRRICVISGRVHSMPQCWQVMRDDQPDWIYEAVRLASLLFCHAVCYQKPFHYKFACSLGPACHVTPDMVHDVLQLTPLRPVWDHLAGVLYWVLMVSAAACHTTDDDDGEAQDDQVESLASHISTTGPSSSSEYTNRCPPFCLPSMTQIGSVDKTSMSGDPPSPHFFAAVDTFSAGKRLFHEYVQERNTGRASNAIQDMNLTTQIAPADGRVTNVSPQPRPVGADRPAPGASIHLFLRDSGFVDPSESPERGSVAVPRQTTTTTTTTTTNSTDTMATTGHAQAGVSHEAKRPRTATSGGGGGGGSSSSGGLKHVERSSSSSSSSQQQRRRKRDKRAYVRRYLTANAVRVSVLLRFEHTTAMVSGVRRFEEVVRWLMNGP